MEISRNSLERLELHQMSKFAEFIVMENFKHHTENELPNDYKKDIESIYKQEMAFYKNSEIFVSKDDFGKISGAIRVLKWNYIDTLPLEIIFGINPLLITPKDELQNIYHIGRFAIRKDVGDLNLFKKLMICAIAPICENKSGIAFAECDSKLLRILNLLGIEASVIGKSINYLGSETIPIAMTYDGLKNFYFKNKSLVENELVSLSTISCLITDSLSIDKHLYN
ncbi:hypothetical protein [Aureivirga marina]|uniref:hypothetical protein n=1 Tax=Aureivirga marina TaxID=1182451 RepID=UPI0018CB782F|nr:hypothetical protein [Aureivirga marina]